MIIGHWLDIYTLIEQEEEEKKMNMVCDVTSQDKRNKDEYEYL